MDFHYFLLSFQLLINQWNRTNTIFLDSDLPLTSSFHLKYCMCSSVCKTSRSTIESLYIMSTCKGSIQIYPQSRIRIPRLSKLVLHPDQISKTFWRQEQELSSPVFWFYARFVFGSRCWTSTSIDSWWGLPLKSFEAHTSFIMWHMTRDSIQ